jgi:alpha-L-fucosidase
MDWFADAKLGIFIHWGIYAVDGIDESWSFYNGKVTYKDYMKQLGGFTAENYDPTSWAQLIRESGARYAVLTSKHHDGVALWDTRAGDLDVVAATPAGLDLIGPYCDALRREGLKVGLYYSLLDWSHPDYPNFTRTEKRYETDTARWASFTAFNLTQIREIMALYYPDLFWFDGDWEQSAENWQAADIREMILENNPDAIINSRLQGYGDYATPEQGIPVKRPQQEHWELCMTMNDSWGFQPTDTNYKPLNLVIRIFADVIANGGNLLLDIGPMADGTIPQQQTEILKGLGRWTAKHAEAIYDTRAGLPKDCFYGPSTISSDSTIVYLFLANHRSKIPDQNRPTDQSSNRPIVQSSNRPTDQPTNHPIVQSSNHPAVLLKGLLTPIKSITVVGTGEELSQKTWLKPWWSNHAGLIEIELPADLADEDMTVLAIQLEGKVKLEY